MIGLTNEMERIEREQRMEELKESIQKARKPDDEQQLILSRGPTTRILKELGLWGGVSRGSIRVGLFCSLYLFHIGSSSRYVPDCTDCCHVLVFGGIRQECYCTAYAAIRALCISSTFWDVITFSFVLGFQWLSEFSVCHFSVCKDSRRTPKEGELDHIRDMFWQEGNIEQDHLRKTILCISIKHLHNHNWAFWQLWARLAF